MKRFITLTTLTWFFLALTAQETKLEIETTTGCLKDLITEEQMQTVTHLILTGSMGNTDFYLIRDYLPKLKELDIKQVNADTIPANVFYDKHFEKIHLPKNVKYLADNSFQSFHGIIIISGQFPKLGNNVFGDSYGITLSEDNEYCKYIGRNIHSMDGKILFFYLTFEPLLVTIADGTETIASRAFDNAIICGLKFPASLKKIEEHAFTNAKRNGYTRVWDEDERLECLYFKSSYPPVLEGDVFNDHYSDRFSSYFIRVPIGSGQYYKEANDQWSIFKSIEEYNFDPASIEPINNKQLRAVKVGNSLFISSEYIINQINTISLDGSLLHSTICNAAKKTIPLQPGINIVKVTFSDKSLKVIKILN